VAHPAPRPRAVRRSDRGAALLVVIVSTAILTALAVDLAYQTRVSLLTAGNARDELRAEYAARGGAQLARLVLRFQNQLDATPSAAGVPRIQVWNLVPVTSALTEGLFGAPSAEEAGPRATFDVTIEDEGRKVNLQMDASGGGGQAFAQVQAFLQLVADPKWDPLFDREDAWGQRFTRQDVVIHLHDWTDANTVGSALTNSPAAPFADGFGDENAPYQHGDDPYQAKNARFDSLDEAYLVAGIDDDFMDAFGKQLTVYVPVSGKINVNTSDPAELMRNARIMADPQNQPRLADPKFPEDLAKMVSELSQGGRITLRPGQFAQILVHFGIQLATAYAADNGQGDAGAFTDRSLVYALHAKGTAGAVERRLDAVITFDPGQLGSQTADLGGLRHWHEE
jgi:general secretion pathway protein K